VSCPATAIRITEGVGGFVVIVILMVVAMVMVMVMIYIHSFESSVHCARPREHDRCRVKGVFVEYNPRHLDRPAYLLVTAITMPFIAQLSNAFGRPAILTACLVFFTIGTILCCLADGISLLLAGRVL
jgi:predicted MFS family arabinose efflux permease